jgi:hypothetical protein
MIEDVASRVSALAADYGEGRLSLEAYRRERTALLDSLPAECAAADSAITRPRFRAPAAESDRPTDGQAPARAPPQARRPRGRWRTWSVLSLGVVALVTFTLWQQKRPGPRVSTLASQTEPVPADAAEPVREAIAPLLASQDWSDARIAAANVGLLEAGPRRIAAAAATDWFQRFLGEVRDHVRDEERERRGTLDPENNPLAALAVTLGIKPEPAVDSSRHRRARAG